MDYIVIIFLSMVFLHIVDDFYLQPGILSNMKQKIWWEKNVDENMIHKYKYDYIVALIIHALSWSIMIHIPWIVYYMANQYPKQDPKSQYIILISVIENAIIHAIIDNEKANKFTINLIVDQSLHFIQIVITCIIMYLYFSH